MALNFIMTTALGFIPDYVMFHFKPEIIVHWFDHFHGAVMSLWLVVFLAQTILAVRGNLKYHRQLGELSLGLGVFIWITMLVVTIRPRISFPAPMPDVTWDVLLVTLFGIILFPPLFGLGMLWRKNVAAHKRLMVLASIVLMQGSIDRIRLLPWLSEASFVAFLYFDLFFVVPLVIYDLLTLKKLHKVTIIGTALILFSQILMTSATQSNWWHKMAFGMFAPFVDPDVEVKLSHAQIAPLLGKYGTKEWYVTVTSEHGKLYLKLPDTPMLEMIATSDSQTSMLSTAWHVRFVRDVDGHVMRIINQQPQVNWALDRLEE